MDPALQELIGEGQPDDDVAIIVRLHPGANTPRGLHVVARFGDIVTARIRRGAIPTIYRSPGIASIKAPRNYTPELEEIFEEATPEILDTDYRRPANLSETGRGVCIAVLDWGCDFTHPDFRNADGSTRLRALWDQRGKGSAAPYGYGTVHDRKAINRALGQTDPLRALRYPIAQAAQHGTHVLGIAAGNGRAGGPAGVAPEADIIFCHLGSSDRDLGNSIELLEALDFAVKQAGDLPLVVNMSVGRHAGPHDSSLLVERAIDWIMVNRPGTAFAQSAGNYYDARCHMEGRLHETLEAELPFDITLRSADNVVVETWYPGADRFQAAVSGPDGIRVTAPRGQKSAITDARGARIGTLYHRANDPNNGDHLIDLVLKPEAPTGRWRILLRGVDVVDGRWHSWIERDTANPKAQARFAEGAAAVSTTTGSICNAMRTIAVGAYDAHNDQHPMGRFSSVGPTRDGRVKPLLTAPGVKILSCRSVAPGAPAYVRMSGTSMAAPHVAGTLALMLQAAGAQPVAAIRRTLFAHLDPVEPENPRRGYGQLAIARVVAAARTLRSSAPAARETAAPETTETPEPVPTKGQPIMASTSALSPFFPAHAGGELLVERALDPGDPGVRLIGWGGRRLAEPLLYGDIITNQNGQMMAMVAAPRLMAQQEATAAGLVTEGPWAGHYVQLLLPDGAPSPFAQRIVAPNGLLLDDIVIMRPTEEEAADAEWYAEEETVLAETRPIVRRGARGVAVQEVQTKLNAAHAHFVATGPGIANCPLSVDGAFGSLTFGAVQSFQRRVFPGEPREWDGVVGPHTWAMLDRYATGGVVVPPRGYTPPGGNIIPISTPPNEATLRSMLTASLLLASNPSANFNAGALPPVTATTGALWDFELSLAGDALTASPVRCSVAHPGHIMLMPVLSRARWHHIAVMEGGQRINLPLSPSFLLGSFDSKSGGITASHPLWKLPSTLDVGCCVVFAFDLRDPTNPAPIADLRELQPYSAGASGNGWAVVCCEMVCNTALNDFEPAGAVDVARFYPLIEVLTNFQNPTILGNVEMIRRAASPMPHGWANGGRHKVGLYADRNLSLGLTESLIEFASGRSGTVLPSWDNLFDYVDADAGRAAQRLTIVDPARGGSRIDRTHRQQINRLTERHDATDVMKVARQGDFDNVHIAPQMEVGPLTIGISPVSATIPATAVSMAPLCAHDCFHMHWRWSRHFTGVGQKGWGSSGPNSADGAPMVPLNQTVTFSTMPGVPGFNYNAVARAQPTGQWAVILHHGAGYAITNRMSPGLLLNAAMTSMHIPAAARSAVMRAIAGAEDKMWAWTYFFFQKWPQLQPPTLTPIDTITFDLPALRAL